MKTWESAAPSCFVSLGTMSQLSPSKAWPRRRTTISSPRAQRESIVVSAFDVAKSVAGPNGGSSKWIHDEFPARRDFAWQEGDGAFRIGVSQIDDSNRYIVHQAEHHRTRTFQEEFLAILQRHRIEYDPRYVWG